MNQIALQILFQADGRQSMILTVTDSLDISLDGS